MLSTENRKGPVWSSYSMVMLTQYATPSFHNHVLLNKSGLAKFREHTNPKQASLILIKLIQ